LSDRRGGRRGLSDIRRHAGTLRRIIWNGRRGLSDIRRRWRLRRIIRNAHADPAIEGEPLVSVVLATYNWSSVLRHSVRSVLWQTYPNFELLVVGDGCTDDSEQVVASFGDDRVRWHNLEANTGSQAIPNQTGIELAKGEYIAYQGHDDVWHPKHLATVVAELERTGADFANSLSEVIGPPGTRVRRLAGLGRPKWVAPASIVHRIGLSRRIGGWRTWEGAGGPPDDDFLSRARASGARLIQVPALTVFKFPSSFRKNAYRKKPSFEQRAYVRRIQRERLFIERELAALTARKLSPLMERLPVERSSEAERTDPQARLARLRRFRGLD
jgi:glycosyltransferase involved in cell wall biosynthesis